MNGNDLLPIGELARRTGLSVSAIRFYEARGLIQPVRTGGNQRRFLRADIRRLSFLMIAQQLGIGLDEIARELAAGAPRHGDQPQPDAARRVGGKRSRECGSHLAIPRFAEESDLRASLQTKQLISERGTTWV